MARLHQVNRGKNQSKITVGRLSTIQRRRVALFVGCHTERSLISACSPPRADSCVAHTRRKNTWFAAGSPDHRAGLRGGRRCHERRRADGRKSVVGGQRYMRQDEGLLAKAEQSINIPSHGQDCLTTQNQSLPMPLARLTSCHTDSGCSGS